MQMLSLSLFLFIVLLGSVNLVSCTDEAAHTTSASKKNRYFNVLLRRRSHTTKEFYAYVEKIRGLHMDQNKPKFRAEVVRVLLNMKLITVKNPSKAALKYFEGQRDIVDMVTEEEKDIEAEL